MDRKQFLQNSADQAQRVIDQLDRAGSSKSSDVRRSAESDKRYYGKQLENEQGGE